MHSISFGDQSLIGRVRLDPRKQLALQVFLGVASVVFIILLLRIFVVQEESVRTARGRLAVGQVLANYFDAQLSDQLQQLARTAARLPQASPASAGSVLEDLRSRMDVSSYGVFLLDPNGQPIAADPPEIGIVGAQLVKRAEVAEALSQGRAAVSGIHQGPGGRGQFGLVVPARIAWVSEGAAPSSVGVLIDPSNARFTDIVAASRSISPLTTAEVVDQFAVVVTATQRERVILPGQFVDLYLAGLRTQEPAISNNVLIPGEAAGEGHLVVFVPLRRAPWGLALSGPESEMLAPIRKWDPPLVALGVATLIILVGLAWLTARSVIQPVRTLIAAAHQIARGDLTSEVPMAGGGDLMQLSSALNEMRRGLREAELARAEIDQLKDEFISSVSHELRTPLGYIKGYTTTLLRSDVGWDQASIQDFLHIIDESSDQLEELVDHLLDMSRITEGVLSVVPEPMRLGSLVLEVAQKAGMRSSTHAITTDVGTNFPLVLADRARIQQVLGNLVDNAMKYSPNGGRVLIGARHDDKVAIIRVEDEGIGIPDGHLEAVFDRFHRGADARVRTIRGVGLGLPICRGIVQAHGGRIWAEHALLGGTVVSFTLPLDTTDFSGFGDADINEGALTRPRV